MGNGGTMAARLGRNAFTEKEIQRIKELILLGTPATEISKRFECSLNAVRRIKKELKCKI